MAGGGGRGPLPIASARACYITRWAPPGRGGGSAQAVSVSLQRGEAGAAGGGVGVGRADRPAPSLAPASPMTASETSPLQDRPLWGSLCVFATGSKNLCPSRARARGQDRAALQPQPVRGRPASLSPASSPPLAAWLCAPYHHAGPTGAVRRVPPLGQPPALPEVCLSPGLFARQEGEGLAPGVPGGCTRQGGHLCPGGEATGPWPPWRWAPVPTFPWLGVGCVGTSPWGLGCGRGVHWAAGP